MSDWKGQRWEYHVTQHDPVTGPANDGDLDLAGSWGWELISVIETQTAAGQRLVYTFKRPIPPPTKVELP